MPPISEREAKEFERLVALGHKLKEDRVRLLGKPIRTEDDSNELSEIDRQLREIDAWFRKTAK